MGRFSQLRCSQEVVALWWVPWILQWVLTECRTPCSRSRSLGGSAPCSISSTSSCPGVWFPFCGNGALLCPSSNGETLVSPPTIAPSLLRRAASNSSSVWSISALDRSSLPNSTSAREDSDGVLMCWSVHSLMFCHHADLLSHSLFSWTSRNRLTQRGLRALSAFMRWGRQGRCWHLMCHFLRDTQSQVRVGASLSPPWQDSGIAQGRVLSPLLFNLLIDTLASDVRPGVRLLSHHRLSQGFLNKKEADADFGQTDLGHPYLTDLGHPYLTDFGQPFIDRLWPKLVFSSFGPTIPPQGGGARETL